MELLKTFKIFSLALVILCASYSNCQITSTTLNHNNVSAHLSDAGTFFYDYTHQKLGYEVPKGANKHIIHSAQFWFAAKNSLGEIHFVQGGKPNEGSDVFNGPISDSSTYSTPEYQNKWSNAIWSICQTDIDNFKLQYECNQDPSCNESYPISNKALHTINNWPAHGDVSLGQSFYLAPFFDYDEDGVYEPSSGDYPLIKGCCATYMIQNDMAESHTYTPSEPIGIELHYLFYQYKTWDYLNNVTFVDIIAINKSNTDYPEFSHSIVVNASIGNPDDDYYGCDSLNNLTYYYNADNNDEDILQQLGYGMDPPAIGIINLTNDMTSSVPYPNEGLSISNKWNLMNGLKADGSPWLNPDSNETQYVFSGNPNISTEWSALSTGQNPGQAKGISSINYGSFGISDTLKQSYAITYARDGDHLENVQSIIDKSSDVQFFYENESNTPCTDGTINLDQQDDFNITISPNPSSGIVYLNNHDQINLSLTVYDLQGNILKEKPFSNDNYFAIDLSKQSSGIYFIHLKTKTSNEVKKIVIE